MRAIIALAFAVNLLGGCAAATAMKESYVRSMAEDPLKKKCEAEGGVSEIFFAGGIALPHCRKPKS